MIFAYYYVVYFVVVLACYMFVNYCLLAVGHVDIEGNAHNGLVVRLPFAALFDTLGM